jgi:hypothetical protein
MSKIDQVLGKVLPRRSNPKPLSPRMRKTIRLGLWIGITTWVLSVGMTMYESVSHKKLPDWLQKTNLACGVFTVSGLAVFMMWDQHRSPAAAAGRAISKNGRLAARALIEVGHCWDEALVEAKQQTDEAQAEAVFARLFKEKFAERVMVPMPKIFRQIEDDFKRESGFTDKEFEQYFKPLPKTDHG